MLQDEIFNNYFIEVHC